jgi:hypothetical protein
MKMKRLTGRGLPARVTDRGDACSLSGAGPEVAKFTGLTRRGPAAFALAFFCALAAPHSAHAQQRAERLANLGDAAAKGTPVAESRPRSPRRIASVRAAGPRVVVTSDSPLDDYTAYRAGARFHVLIPRADASALSQDLSGAGPAGARVERRGDGVVLSFALPENVSARVRQSFNRLEVLFEPRDAHQQGGAPAPAQTPPPSPEPAAPPASAVTESGEPKPAVPTTSDSSVAREAAGAARLAASRGRAVPPEKAAPVRVPKFDRAPAIDGRLDDEVWKRAAVFRDFYQIQPGDNIAPSKPTEMRMGYDSKTLYLAVRATDDPDKVRATIPKRDAIFDDDYVGIYFDTFNDRRKAYALFFSPLGVQADGIFTEGQGEDLSLDIVMESKGAVTPEGYVIEVAIPFKSLRYTAGGDKVWNVQLFRRIQRFNGELSSWMPISRDVQGTLNQAGQIAGLEGISAERTLELIPSLTLSQTGRRVRSVPPEPFGDGGARRPAVPDPGRFVNPAVDYDVGLTAKYTLTPTVTLDFAYNPDFAQVEADATVVTANQRFPIFFSEKRPFFLEGREIFETRSTVVHTRAIVDPDYAVKLTGKQGRNSFGLILASDNAPGNFSDDELAERRLRDVMSEPDRAARALREAEFRGFLDRVVGRNATVGVLRLKRDVGRDGSLGLFGTTYNFTDRYNHVAGFDGRFKIDPKTILAFEVLGTATRDRRDRATGEMLPYRKAFGYSWEWDYTGRNFGYQFSGGGRTRDYRTDVGFVRRVNTNNVVFGWRYSTDPDPKAALTEFRFQHFVVSNFDWQARHQNAETGVNLDFKLARQTFVRVGLNYAYERLFEEEFGGPGSFFGTDSERSTYIKTVFAVLEKTFNKQLSGFAFLGTRRGLFDLDFGAGPRYPRVSPSAIAAREAAAAGLCAVTGERPDPPPACRGLQDPGPGDGVDAELGFTYRPTSALNLSLNYTKARLARRDTDRVAFDDNIFALRSTYQFTRFLFARARVDYDTLAANVRGQFLFGWTPNPGTAFYAGYNDDLNRNGFNPFSGQLEPGFRRNGRTFFVKMSYLFRRSFGE